MLGKYFYHEVFRKTVVGFGTLFNNIEIKQGSEVMKVPLAYGPKQKFLARLEQTPDPTNKRVGITLPRISFEITGIDYDPARKVSPTQKITVTSTSDKSKVAYMPVPYNVTFELAIISKTQDDGLEILEQILPYFQPSYNLPLKLVPGLNETKDVPVVINNIDYDDEYEGNFASRRAIIYTLGFTAKTYVYGPVQESSVITKVIADAYTSTAVSTAPREVRYTVTPDPITADADDDFGFGVTTEEFTDNEKRNPTSGQDEPL